MADDFESTLARLSRETDGLGPAPGFADRVVAAAIETTTFGFGAGVVRFGKTMIAIAALSAVAAVALGLQSERAVDEALATSFGAEELDW